jgi:hypothetical protein
LRSIFDEASNHIGILDGTQKGEAHRVDLGGSILVGQQDKSILEWVREYVEKDGQDMA